MKRNRKDELGPDPAGPWRPRKGAWVLITVVTQSNFCF